MNGAEHGIIASLSDISPGYQWSNITTTLIGAGAASPVNGPANTTAIIAQAGHVSSAAQLCLNYNGGGYTDWYLGAAWEMTLCFNSGFVVNEVLGDVNGFQKASYWTSTEFNSTFAYVWSFGNGGLAGTGKSGNLHVRAVRRY